MAAEDKNLPVAVHDSSIFFNVAKFELAQRVAKVFAESTLVPKAFQGSIANCVIALNYAERVGLDPFMTMQNMYIVHGRPGIEAKFVIALINQSGKYSEPLKFKFDGQGDDYGCTAYTVEAKSRETVVGPKITMKMVKAEGWDQDKKNKETGYVQKSKWTTMPDMMFRYRAASYFANVNCPELKLGMQTVEDLHDIVEMEPTANGNYDISEKTREKMEDLKQRLMPPPAPAPAMESEPDSTEHDPGKKRTRKPKTEPQPTSPVTEQEPGGPVDPEVAELAAVQKRIKEIEAQNWPYVAQARRNLGIAHAMTLDAANRILEETERLLKERPPK